MSTKKNQLKYLIALFFAVLFFTITIAPTIISLIDNNTDSAMYVNTPEEEESEAKEIFYDFKLYLNTALQLCVIQRKKKKPFLFFSENYSSAFLKISTPPPRRFSYFFLTLYFF